MTETATRLSAQQIVDGLRSTDPDTRTKALEALYPAATASAVIAVQPGGGWITTPSQCDGSHLFAAALRLVVFLGQQLGMDLRWVQPKQTGPKIEVAPAGMFQ